jgi:hypothetical protein
MASSRWPQFWCVQANPLSHNRRGNDEHHGVSQDARAVMHRATEMKVTLNHREGHNLDHSPQFGERLDIEAVLRELFVMSSVVMLCGFPVVVGGMRKMF